MGQTPLSRTPRQGGRAKSDGQHQNGVEDKESADSDKDRMSLSIKAHTHNGCSHQQHSVGEDLSLPKTPKPKRLRIIETTSAAFQSVIGSHLTYIPIRRRSMISFILTALPQTTPKASTAPERPERLFSQRPCSPPFFICLNDEGDEDEGPPPPSHNRVTVLSKPGPSRHG